MSDHKKSKKIIILIVVLLIAILATIGFVILKGRGTVSANGTENVKTEISNKETNASSNEKATTNLGNTFKIPGNDIYMNVPNWPKIEHGYTDVFKYGGIKYIAVTCDKESQGVSFDEAHEKAYAIFQHSVQNYNYVNKLTTTQEQITTVNGIKVYRYEGTLNCSKSFNDLENTYEIYTVGYSFVMDGLACNISGVVNAKSQPQDAIDEVRELVDKMMKTVRNQE